MAQLEKLGAELHKECRAKDDLKSILAGQGEAAAELARLRAALDRMPQLVLAVAGEATQALGEQQRRLAELEAHNSQLTVKLGLVEAALADMQGELLVEMARREEELEAVDAEEGGQELKEVRATMGRLQDELDASQNEVLSLQVYSIVQ